MSYILDALKKSEQERQQGRVPDLTSAPIVIGRASTGAGASRRPYLIAAVVLLATAGALIWVRPWQSGQATPAAVPAARIGSPLAAPARVEPDSHVELPVALPRAANAPAAAATAAKHREQSPAAAAAAARPPDVTVQPARSATAGSTGRDAVETPPNAQQRTEPIPPHVPAAAHTAPAEPVPLATASAPAPPAARPAVVPEPMPAARPLTAPAAKAESGKSAGPAAAKGVSKLAELPPAVRKSVARIDVAGFSYSDDPQARMAVINDRILHEGDEVVPGVRLEKIGSDGIVFSHKGIRFRP